MTAWTDGQTEGQQHGWGSKESSGPITRDSLTGSLKRGRGRFTAWLSERRQGMGWGTECGGAPLSGGTSKWASSGITVSHPVGCLSAYERRTQRRPDSHILTNSSKAGCLRQKCRLLLCGPDAQVLTQRSGDRGRKSDLISLLAHTHLSQ